MWSAVTASVVYQAIGVLILGYLDKWFLPALLLGAASSFLVAMVADVPFLIYRKRQTTTTSR
jgi:hypothetical protein